MPSALSNTATALATRAARAQPIGSATAKGVGRYIEGGRCAEVGAATWRGGRRAKEAPGLMGPNGTKRDLGGVLVRYQDLDEVPFRETVPNGTKTYRTGSRSNHH